MIKLPPRFLGVAAAAGLLAGALATALVFMPGLRARTNGCVEQAAVEFGALPLNSNVADRAVPKYDGKTNTCIPPVKLVESCGFQGADGVAYALFEGSVLKKTRLLPDQAATGPRLKLTRDTSRDEARQRLRELGDDPVSHQGEGPPRLIVSLCPAETGSSWFEIWFDDVGRARGVELGSAI